MEEAIKQLTPSKRKKQDMSSSPTDEEIFDINMRIGNEIEFINYALFDFYQVEYPKMQDMVRKLEKLNILNENTSEECFMRTSIDQMEYYLSIYTQTPSKLITSTINHYANLKWKSTAVLGLDTFKVFHQAPEGSESSCAYWRKFGNSRFLHVDIRGKLDANGEYFVPDRFLNKEPFIFGGRLYRFLGGKLENKPNDSEERDDLFTAWLFAERSIHGRTLIEPITVQQARDWLGDPASMGTLSKMNARFSLGFSMTLPCCRVHLKNIYITMDIKSPAGGVMTDGCGYIHSSLVDSVPYGISSGVPVNKSSETFSRIGRNMALPVILQIRLICSKGLFKGCLLVTSDVTLCKTDSVVLTESMCKAKGSGSGSGSGQGHYDFCTIDVCNTFEHPQLLAQTDSEYSDDFQNSVPTHLNRNVILLLVHLGVPPGVFEQIVRSELEKVVHVFIDRACAYKLVKKSIRSECYKNRRSLEDKEQSGVSVGGARDDQPPRGEDGDAASSSFNMTQLSQVIFNLEQHLDVPNRITSTGDRREYDKSVLQLNGDANTDARASLLFLACGHDVYEPHFMAILRKMQMAYYKKLRKCNIRVPNAMYLVGAPDPYGVLQPGEVYISYPCDRYKGVEQAKNCTTYTTFDEGDVLVTRNPTLHPGDIRKLRAVENDMLASFVHGTMGGIIFFSVLGDRSEADKMGGGDYDGDLYLVFFSGSTIVPLVNQVDAYVDPAKCDKTAPKPTAVTEPTTDSTAAHIDSNQLTWDIFKYLCKSASGKLVGVYTYAWFAFADSRDPSDKDAIACATLVYRALDAAKTSAEVKGSEKLRREPKPHYLEAKAYTQVRHSRSILGVLYDMVLAAERDLRLPEDMDKQHLMRDRGLICDKDLVSDTLRVQQTAKYNEWRTHLETYKSEMVSLLSSSRDPSVHVNDRIKTMKGLYRAKYIEDSLILMRLDPDYDVSKNRRSLVNTVVLLESMKTLASGIYQLTYHAAKKKEKSGDSFEYMYSTSFCWDVCGKVLHKMKFDAVKDSHHENKHLDTFIEAEFGFLFM